jgi:hypothetical protein
MMALEYALEQRAYDGKWQLLGKIKDMENTYTYNTETGQKVSLIPEKWITLKVFDYIGEYTYE